jgi:hypothetical protein
MTSPLNLEPKTRIADLGGVIRFAPGSEFTRLYLMRDFRTLAERYPREFVEPIGGNLAAMARELFVEKTANDVVCLEGLKVHCRTLVDDLAGPDPSPVLRLAVEAARSSEFRGHYTYLPTLPAGMAMASATQHTAGPGADRLDDTRLSQHRRPRWQAL